LLAAIPRAKLTEAEGVNFSVLYIMLLENWTKICQCRREKWNDAKTETEAIYRRI
jgi:hypothetical protein